MGLDVGVVTIEYLSEPPQQAQDFLYDMLLDPYAGVFDDDGDDDEIWGDSWADNGVYEFERASLIHGANNWAASRAISQSALNDLLTWVEALPWQDDMVTLHLGR